MNTVGNVMKEKRQWHDSTLKNTGARHGCEHPVSPASWYSILAQSPLLDLHWPWTCFCPRGCSGWDGADFKAGHKETCSFMKASDLLSGETSYCVVMQPPWEHYTVRRPKLVSRESTWERCPATLSHRRRDTREVHECRYHLPRDPAATRLQPYKETPSENHPAESSQSTGAWETSCSCKPLSCAEACEPAVCHQDT